MNNPIDIDVIIDSNYIEPNVIIKTKERTTLVDNIVLAVENIAEKHIERIPSYDGNELTLISQRDIIRAYSQMHKVIIETDDNSYLVKDTLISLEEKLDSERYIRISRSEIINLYKVDFFDFSVRGAIGIQFNNGTKTWVSRRYLKSIREFLK